MQSKTKLSPPSSFLRIAIDSPLYRLFDYLPPDGCDVAKLQPGVRVHVPFGRREVVGFLLKVVHETDVPKNKLRSALAILDAEPLVAKDIVHLILWAAKYYHYPLGATFACALPKHLRNVKGMATLMRVRKQIAKEFADKEVTKLLVTQPSFELNSDQKSAIEAIGNSNSLFLLDGVTGSGKTEVYLQTIAKVLKQGKQALVLIPEIGLTPQTVKRFKERFPVAIALLHSRLTDRERLYNWMLAALGYAKIIIGTRSAIFTPLKNPGIIVIDEEHDLSFRQQSGLRYATRDLAAERARFLQIPLVLGSATPALISLHRVRNGEYKHLLLPERAGKSIHPRFKVVNLVGAKVRGAFSQDLLDAMQRHIDAGNQVLVFLNRRGYAPTIMCHTCGWKAECSHCDVRLTLHQSPSFLSCHHCGRETSVPEKCPNCGSNNILALGLGTERAEVLLGKFFPGVKMHRIDRDTTKRKGSLESMFDDVVSGECQLLLGTQMLTKGHHFPNVTLVAILNADSGLFSADFQAIEYLAALIIQVAGRAGRSDKPSEVYIETHHPEHPLLQRLVKNGYASFAQDALEERCDTHLPPFINLALLRVESRDAVSGMLFLQQVKRYCLVNKGTSVSILGPVKAIITRMAGQYRAQLWLQSFERKELDTLLTGIISWLLRNPKLSCGVKWFFDVDPVEG